jgi:VanZ family protein
MYRTILFYFWLAAVTALSLLPRDAMPECVHFPVGANKGVHILMYMALARIALPALLKPCDWHTYRRIGLVLAGVATYGMLLEILQPLITTRSFEWADVLANAAGCIGGYLLWERKRI